ATLLYFFGSSSGLSRAFARRKRAIERDKFAKGSQRDLAQVAANGGVAAALALASATASGRQRRGLLMAGFVGALATANADTWATEIGTLSRRPPRLITTGRVVEAGTSGGVTALGLAATTAGALSLSAVHLAARRLVRGRDPASEPWRTCAAATVGGVAGSLVDSVLGAVWQAMYRCPRCAVETERRVHSCGTRTEYVRGVPWMDNDVVNALSTASGALVGGAVWRLARRTSQLPGGD
ncbi:MAG TPA: DUF92 domain-containing protein, partial [Steroidobacteraceae bacterium]|nr:DUF92 domain-containing protein [Steroidobacteraceae bacterium]